MAHEVKANSSTLLSGRDRATARSFYKAIGFTDEDLQKPIIGIANTWTETMPCNFNLRQLAVRVKEGVRAAGGTPMEFNTIAISDGITMGTEGMKASLVSRELIADSMELMARGYMFDAMIALVACDKTNPAGAMALLRLNIPGLAACGRAASSPKRRSRTRSRASPPPAARPTPCCTSWRWRATRACRSRWTISIASAVARRCWATCALAANMRPTIWIALAARASWRSGWCRAALQIPTR